MHQTRSKRSTGFPHSYVLLAATGINILAGCVRDAEGGPRVHTIAIRGFEYAPVNITVEVGDTIVWTNEDLVPHTATATGRGLDTGSIAPAASERYVAEERGTYGYDCTFHPGMKGTLVVQ